MKKKVRVLVVHSYGFDLSPLAALFYNLSLVDWVVKNARRYDLILLVGGWIPGISAEPPVCVWQMKRLISRGVSKKKLFTPRDVLPGQLMPRDTIEELWAAGEMLRLLGHAKDSIVIHAVGMDYHKTRIEACIKAIDAKIRVVALKSVQKHKSHWFYKFIAWTGLWLSYKGTGPVFYVVRIFRTFDWKWGMKPITTTFWNKKRSLQCLMESVLNVMPKLSWNKNLLKAKLWYVRNVVLTWRWIPRTR